MNFLVWELYLRKNKQKSYFSAFTIKKTKHKDCLKGENSASSTVTHASSFWLTVYVFLILFVLGFCLLLLLLLFWCVCVCAFGHATQLMGF